MNVCSAVKHRSYVLALILSVILCAMPYSAVEATFVLDQIYFDPPASVFGGTTRADNSFRRAETFTVGVAGPLNSVDVRGIPGSGLRILATIGGVPVTTVLASTSARLFPGDGWIGWDLSSSGLTVTVGEILAVELLDGGWDGQSPGKYAGGADYIVNLPGIPNFTLDPNSDFFFRTFVGTNRIPEPSAVFLLTIGAVIFFWVKLKYR